MKRIILFSLISLSLSATAQNDTSKNYEPPMIIRMLGFSYQKFDGLKGRVANRPEFKQLRDFAGSIDLGLLRIHDRFISEIDLGIASSMSGDRDRKSSTVRYLSAGVDFGYDLIGADKFLLYPLVGLGGQRYQARFYRDNSAVPFDLLLSSPAIQNDIKPVDFINSFFTYRLGFGFAVKPSKNDGALVGIQAGYTGSFKDKSWKSSDNQELAGAPVDKLSQYHVSLILTNMPGMKRGMK